MDQKIHLLWQVCGIGHSEGWKWCAWSAILDIEYKLMKFKSCTAVVDVSFLSSEFLLMIEEDPDVYHFSVFSFEKNQITHYLELPSSQPIETAYFITHPSYDSSGSSPARHLNWIGPDPSVDIIVASLDFDSYDRWFLVLSIAKILKTLDKLEGVPIVVAWDEWGTHATRWLPGSELQEGSLRSVFGSRLLAFTHVDLYKGLDIGVPPDHLVLFDFNPRLIGREANSGNSPIVIEDESRRVVEVIDPSPIASPFEYIPALAGLPFRAVIDKRPCTYDSAYWDGTVIVGCTVCTTLLLLNEALLISGNQDNSYEFRSFLPRNEEMENHSYSSSPD
jgi:hypothetical protein